MTVGDELGPGPITLDVGLQQGIQDFVGRQALIVALVRPELGRWRLREDPVGNHGAAVTARLTGIAPATELVHLGLVHVLDHGIGTGGVAVERGVADSRLALVPGGQYQPAVGVGAGHQQDPADTGLQVLVGQPGRLTVWRHRQGSGERHVDVFDVQGGHVQPLRGDQGLGIGYRVAARVPGRHQHGVDVLRTEGVGGDGGHQRRVHPTREAEADVAEAALADVVTRRGHQGLVELCHLVQRQQGRRHEVVVAFHCPGHLHHQKVVVARLHRRNVHVEDDHGLPKPWSSTDNQP